MGTPARIWKRRAVAMAIVGLAVALPVTIAVSDGAESNPAVTGDTAGASVPALRPEVLNRDLGVSYRVPQGWRERDRRRAVSLQSRDRTVQIVIAAPAPAKASGRVLDEAVAAVRSGYRRVRIERGSGSRLGGLRVNGAVASARNPDGTPLRILMAVARGERRTFLVEVFTAAAASGKRIREAQVALNSLRFRR
jgi:hypothetical protein